MLRSGLCRSGRILTRSLSSSHTKGKSNVFDVAICGGGLVGSTLAAALGYDELAAPLRVALIDPKPPPNEKPDGFTLRTSTVSPASRNWLQRVGVWCDEDATSFDDMFVYDQKSSIGFNSRETEAEHLGYVVENDRLRCSIYSKLRSKAGSLGAQVELVQASVQDIQFRDGDFVKIALKDRGPLEARLIVGAEGAKSLTRTAAKIPAWNYDYGQRAVVANVRARRPDRTAWQRFLSTGPVALLPIAQGEVFNVVWTTTPAEAEVLQSVDESTFLEELNIAFDENWNDQVPPEAIEVIGRRASFPLHAAHATEYTRSRVALVGDAAHSVHPLAGQGVNIGFGDAEALSECLARGAATGRDVGEESALLLKYQGQRMPSNLLMTGVLHSLHAVYGVQNEQFAVARGLGMKALDNFGPLKRKVIEFALSGKL